MSRALLIINIAGLSRASVGSLTPNISKLVDDGGGITSLQPPVPALTSPSQATILTGSLPSEHGIVANGWYFRDLALILNWQRSARLISGEPIWEAARAIDASSRCANLFWRYAAHSTCDVNVMERPTYWADGGKSEDIYTEPGSVHDELVQKLGPFPLFRFWGPAADITSTRWIVDATLQIMSRKHFSLILTYLPHLDYDHQRLGPVSPEGERALRDLDTEAGRLIDAACEAQIDVALVSDYAFEPVSQPVYLNRVLREHGLIQVQRAQNGELLEPGASSAFAVCDQQIAHVYVNDNSQLSKVRTLLSDIEGVEQVLDRNAKADLGIDHARSGELLVISESDCWFAYPYWLEGDQAPDFARCVAIHAKPGWDPTELFLAPGFGGKLRLGKRVLQKKLGFRAPFDVINTDATQVRGSHGRIPNGHETRPVLITNWQPNLSDITSMQEVKSIILQRLAATSK